MTQRRVVIKDEESRHDSFGFVRPSYDSYVLAIPTGDARHMPAIREGRIKSYQSTEDKLHATSHKKRAPTEDQEEVA